jgi:hypothetical protein
MEKCTVKLVVFNGEDFSYKKNRTRNYHLSQGRAIWEIIQEASSSIWDIGQVLEENFNWLPFNPPLVTFSSPSRAA